MPADKFNKYNEIFINPYSKHLKMATDKFVEQIKEVMSKPENIRNVCTCAHIDHGIC